MSKILTAPNSILSKPAKPYSFSDTSLPKLLEEMRKALLSARDPAGVGLAAPQVGKSLQIFIAKPSSKLPIQVFINPKLIQKTKISHLTVDNDRVNKLNKTIGEKPSTKLEGCLSLPNIWGEVKRAPSVKISYLNENGKEYSKEFNSFMATIIQHEMDHLNGVLFPKRVLEQKGTIYKSRKNEKGEDIFEEIEI